MKDQMTISEKEDKSDDGNDKAKKDGIIKKIANALKTAVSNYTADKAGDLLDELFLGNFKDAVIDVYKNQELRKMDDSQLEETMKQLEENPQYKRGKDYAELDSRKDDNTSTSIDSTSVKLWMMWKSKDEEADLGKTINQIVVDFQKSAVEVEKQKKELVSKLKSMKIDITDEEFSQFGPVLQEVVDKGDPKEVQKKIKELRKQLKESFDTIMNQRHFRSIMLNEGKHFLIEEEKQQIMLDALLECKDFQEWLCSSNMVNEGLFSAIGDAAKALGKKVKELGGKAIQSVTKGAIMPILSLGSLSASIFTGGWAAAGILKLMYIIEKQGKKLRNGFEKAYTMYANSKGAIAKMDFSIEGKKDLKYSMRFYEKDMVWRVINTSDQLKKPGKDFAKQIVIDSEDGKRFRNILKKTWDPLFLDSKGGKIDIKAILSQAKSVDIPEKYIDLYSQFAENYDQIKANCIESPKVDTRTQSLKKDN